MQMLETLLFYTGNELDTDRRNIEVKNRKPLEPPGTSARIIKNSVIVCITAAIIVKMVFCINMAK